MSTIDKGIRVTNFIIDMIVIQLVSIILILLFPYYDVIDAELAILMFLYYLLMESILGQTVGKYFTKTKVVSNLGKKASVFNVFIRTILRFIPIDGMSYLFGTERGFHDVLSLTKLIRKK